MGSAAGRLIAEREARFDVMFEVLETAFGGAFTAIDAACGPGSLSRRLLDRFPAARVVAIDADVMLLEMARVTLAGYADRVRVIEADLAGRSWAEQARVAADALGGGAPAALLSTTALHWLSPPKATLIKAMSTNVDRDPHPVRRP